MSGVIRKPSKCLLFLSLCAFLTLSQQHAMADPITATWVGADNSIGNWSDPTNWSTNPAYPNNLTYDVILSSNGVTHVLDTSPAINSLTMNGTNSMLQAAPGQILTVNASMLVGATNSVILEGGIGFNAPGSTLNTLNLDNFGIVTVGAAGSLLADPALANVFGDINNAGTMVLAEKAFAGSGWGRVRDHGNFNNTGSATIGGDLSVMGSYVQSGSGSYTQVQGTLNALSVDVQGGVLAGGGAINSDVTIESGGTIAPGDDPSNMTITGNLTMDGTMGEEIGDPNVYDPDFDSIAVNGDISVDGSLNVDLLAGFVPIAGYQYVILTWTGSAGDENLSIVDPNIGGGLMWELVWDNADSQLILEAEETGGSVPEPASLWLLGTGLAALLARRKRRV